MYKTILRFFLLFAICPVTGQDFSALWEAHFSYNNVIDVVSGQDKIYAASENAVFEYNTTTTELNTITTVEGLSGQEISSIHYSEAYQYLIIGYESGLLEVYSETDGSILTVVDIVDKANITPINKRINHFYEDQGFVYIATDYGISIYDLERLEFGDSYFIGNGGEQITVNQTTIKDNQIYAACLNGNGLKRADLSNPNLIDFNQWETVIGGDFLTVNTINNKIYSVRNNNAVYEIDASSFNIISTLPFSPIDAKVSNTNILFTSANTTRVYDGDFQLVSSFLPSMEFDTSFTSATQLGDYVYIGTSDFGVLEILISDTDSYLSILPNGPLENSIYKLNAETGTVWATYGEYSAVLNPYPLTRKGLSIYNEKQWGNMPYEDLFNTAELNEIAVNPFKPNQVLVSSFFQGLLVFEDFEPSILLNETNSGLESLILPGAPNYVDIRVSATDFDSNGLLWLMTSRVDRALKSYDPIAGTWQGYSFSALINDPLEDELGFFDLEIDQNGTKWIGTYSNGLIAYNENISNEPLRNMNSVDQGVDPFTRFIALALDNRNQLWVGTTFGLKVLNNTLGFYNDPNPTLEIIVIDEAGIPKELLEGQTITDIKVDGSNNKWVGTADSGVFYFTPNGQSTIYHFTTDNSPLPSNTINDISLDPNSGVVYIATNKGLLAFTAGGSEPKETLNDAYVYPNPVRPEYNILGFNNLNDITKGVKIPGLTERVNIKITDIEGNLVAEAQSGVNLRSSSNNYNLAIDGGTAVWNGKNLANQVVRSGVYLIMVSDLVSFETKVLKLLIVR